MTSVKVPPRSIQKSQPRFPAMPRPSLWRAYERSYDGRNQAKRDDPMDTVRFGKTGMQVSKLCLGCMTYGSTKWREWVLEEEASRPFIREALEKGINFFDTADVYSQGVSEEILGRALKEYAAKRSDVVIATKVHGGMGASPNAKGLSRKHIMEAIDASLKRLGTDYVDLYQIHRFDPAT